MSNMKPKSGHWALGLFALASVISVACGGSSDDGDNNGAAGSGAGTTSKAGTTGTAGTSSSTAGTTSNTGGTANNTGGTVNNTGGRNNNTGGSNDFPGLGGAGFEVPGCPAGTMDGETCTAGGQNPCQLNDTTYCGCQGGSWACVDTDDLPGAAGAGSGLGNATCPAGAMTGDTCTNGPGLCPGQQCYCLPSGTTQCIP
jgi:hypothetical protein